MNDITIGDLERWKTASQEERETSRLTPGTKIHLSDLPTEGLYREFYDFWMDQIGKLRLSSIRHDCWPFHQLVRFLKEEYPRLDSLLELPEDVADRELSKWLFKTGQSLYVKKKRTNTGVTDTGRSQARTLLSKVYRFLYDRSYSFSMNEDIWDLDSLPFAVSQNETHRAKTLSFRRLKTEPYKDEVKRAVFSLLQFTDVCTAQLAIRAAGRLEEFLAVKFPAVKSLKQISRKQMEEFLIFVNVSRMKNAYAVLYALKGLLVESSKIEECEKLGKLIIVDDISMHRRHVEFKAFSDDEIRRFNSLLPILDEQVARILLIHQLTGNRINETLSLTKGCLVERNGNMMLRVYQHKTSRSALKPVTKEVAALIRRSLEYTEATCGPTQYIFPKTGHPDLPMSYSALQYHLSKALNETQLKDDHGRLFGVDTHMFRHSYAKRLTELHIPDETIAKLLGHANTASLKYYRKFADAKLAEETKEIRGRMSDMLDELSKGW